LLEDAKTLREGGLGETQTQKILLDLPKCKPKILSALPSAGCARVVRQPAKTTWKPSGLRFGLRKWKPLLGKDAARYLKTFNVFVVWKCTGLRESLKNTHGRRNPDEGDLQASHKAIQEGPARGKRAEKC
jgi:hypothetical protein